MRLGTFTVLRRRKDFQRLQGTGRRNRGKYLLWCFDASRECHQINQAVGLTISRKVGGAVIRNRLRRQLREIIRQNPPLEGVSCELVIIVLPMARTATFVELEQDMAALNSKAQICLGTSKS